MPRPKGSKNKAASKNVWVGFRCHMADKNSWVKTAQAKGSTLTRWIIDTLNDASKKP